MDTSRFDLSGRTALITGGGGLLGPEHGIGLARFGAAIVLIDINEDGLRNAKERVLSQIPEAFVETAIVDIIDEQALCVLRDRLKCDGFHIDILINNAVLNPKMDTFIGETSGTVENYDMDLWEQELKVGG